MSPTFSARHQSELDPNSSHDTRERIQTEHPETDTSQCCEIHGTTGWLVFT